MKIPSEIKPPFKGMIGTNKANLLAKGSKDLDPAQLQQQAEDEIALEAIINEVTKAKDVLNNTSDWLSCHPLEVNFNFVNFFPMFFFCMRSVTV